MAHDPLRPLTLPEWLQTRKRRLARATVGLGSAFVLALSALRATPLATWESLAWIFNHQMLVAVGLNFLVVVGLVFVALPRRPRQAPNRPGSARALRLFVGCWKTAWGLWGIGYTALLLATVAALPQFDLPQLARFCQVAAHVVLLAQTVPLYFCFRVLHVGSRLGTADQLGITQWGIAVAIVLAIAILAFNSGWLMIVMACACGMAYATVIGLIAGKLQAPSLSVPLPILLHLHVYSATQPVLALLMVGPQLGAESSIDIPLLTSALLGCVAYWKLALFVTICWLLDQHYIQFHIEKTSSLRSRRDTDILTFLSKDDPPPSITYLRGDTVQLAQQCFDLLGRRFAQAVLPSQREFLRWLKCTDQERWPCGHSMAVRCASVTRSASVAGVVFFVVCKDHRMLFISYLATSPKTAASITSMLLGEVNRLAESEYPEVDTCVAEVVLDSQLHGGKRSASSALLRVLDAQARRQRLCLRAPDFEYSHPDITHGERPGRSRLLLCSRTTFDSVSRERMTEIIDFVASCIYGNMYPEPAAASLFHASLSTWRTATLARIPEVVRCDRLKDISLP